ATAQVRPDRAQARPVQGSQDVSAPRALLTFAVLAVACFLIGRPWTDVAAEEPGTVKLVGDKATVQKLIRDDILAVNKALSGAEPGRKGVRRATMLAVAIGLSGQAR